jgi:hypothetical protein
MPGLGIGLGAPFRAQVPGGPALASEVLQWLNGIEDDAYTISDKLDITRPEPIVGDVACLAFTTAQNMDSPAVVLGDKFTITFSGYVSSTGDSFGNLFINETSAAEGVVGIIRAATNPSCTLYLRPNGSPANQNVPITRDIFDDEVHDIIITYDNGAVSILVDGEESTGSITPYNGFANADDFRVGTNTAGTQGVTLDLYDFAVIPDVGDGFHYTSEEQYGLPMDVSGAGNHAVAMTSTWTTKDDIPSTNAQDGHTPSVVSDGTGQFIDLGLLGKLNEDFVMEVSGTYTQGEFGNHGALNITGGVRRFYMGMDQLAGRIQFGCGLDLATTAAIIQDHYVLKMNGIGQCYVDGNLEAQVIVTGDAPDINLTMFARNYNGTGEDRYVDGVVDYLKIWDAGVLVRDMVPLPNGEFLDRANNVVYSNDGTGTLATRYAPALAYKTKSVGTFDGVGDFIGVPTIDFSDAIDTTIVINVDSVVSQNIASYAYSFSTKKGIRIRTDATGHIQFATGNGVTAPELTSALAITTVGNQTVRCTWDGAVKRIYINGVLDANTAVYTDTVVAEALQYYLGRYSSSYFTGRMLSASALGSADGFSYDLTQYFGKSTTTIIDNSGNGNDGSVSTGAGGLEAFWAVRIEDSAGVLVDAANYLPITNAGGYVHNGSEVTIRQSDFTVGVFDGVADFVSIPPVLMYDKLYSAVMILPSALVASIYGSGDSASASSLTVKFRDGGGFPKLFIRSGNVALSATTQVDLSVPVEHRHFFDDEYHNLNLLMSTTHLILTIDGVTVFDEDITWNNGDPSEVISTIRIGFSRAAGVGIQYYDGAIKSASIAGYLEYLFNDNAGIGTNTVFDSSGNSNDGTITTGAGGLETFWAVDNSQHTLVDNPFWYSAGWLKKSYEDIYLHNPYDDGVVQKWAKPDDACLVDELLSWPFDQEWSTAELSRTERWRGSGPCGAAPALSAFSGGFDSGFGA